MVFFSNLRQIFTPLCLLWNRPIENIQAAAFTPQESYVSKPLTTNKAEKQQMAQYRK